MTLPNIFLMLSIVVWALPPFRHLKTEYFVCFLIFAIADPIAFSFVALHIAKPQFIMPTIELFLLFSLMQKNERNFIVILAAIIILNYTIWLFPKSVFLVSAFIHIAIVLEILSKFLMQIYNQNKINLFLILFTAYELSNSIKYFVVYADITIGSFYFVLTSLSQIIFGIIFIFININTKSFRINAGLLK